LDIIRKIKERKGPGLGLGSVNLVVGLGSDSIIVLVVAEIMQEQVKLITVVDFAAGEVEKSLAPLGELNLIHDTVLCEDGAKHKEVLKGAARFLLSGSELLLEIGVSILRLNRSDVILPLPDD